MRLTLPARAAIPTSKFAGPDRTFPVEDAAHAHAAIMDSGSAPPAERAEIVARARAALASIRLKRR